MDKYIAIDIGGTNIKSGIITRLGEVIKFFEIPTNAKDGGDKLLKRIISLIKNLDNKDIVGIGISTAGQICPKTGKILYASDNLPGWTGIELRKEIIKRFNKPTFVENDVNAAALGESFMGAGKDERNFLCTTIGTGIGGAIIIDKKVYHGINGSAGEWGHMSIVKDGKVCNCGKKGCFERYASTNALIEYAEKKYSEKDIYERLNGKVIFDRAKRGDIISLEAIEWFSDNIAYGLSSIIHIFNPSLIIIGGGVSKQGDYLLDKIKEKIKLYTMESFLDGLNIKFAQCGNKAGLLGATFGVMNLQKGDK